MDAWESDQAGFAAPSIRGAGLRLNCPPQRTFQSGSAPASWKGCVPGLGAMSFPRGSGLVGAGAAS